MELNEILARFDGKHVGELRAAAAELEDAELALLPGFCTGSHAVAATWMVKHLVELDRQVVLAEAIEHLNVDLPWEAQLHLLQSVQHAPDTALGKLGAIRALLDHRKTLVRVWALDALVRVWTVEPTLAKEAPTLVRQALHDKTASLRARARHLAKIVGVQP